MYRLARFDVTRRIARPGVRLAAQIAFGLLCSAMVLGLLIIVKQWVPLAGPFTFVFPAVVIATLYGHWPAGLVALATSIGATWLLILPGSSPISFEGSSAGSRALLAGFVGLVLLLLAETFRGTVARHAAARDREIERGAVLLRELEHRTRNNFALVASLLEFQRRQSSDPEVMRALDQAIGRIHIFADAYMQFDTTAPAGTQVDMKSYLLRLVERVAEALFDQRISIEADIAGLTLPSKKAVAIGLYVNEALTNCAKYAFPDDRSGTITLSLTGNKASWRLIVQDDGVGNSAQPGKRGRPGGLGGILFEALAAQAGARHEVTLPEVGRRLDLVSLG